MEEGKKVHKTERYREGLKKEIDEIRYIDISVDNGIGTWKGPETGQKVKG